MHHQVANLREDALHKLTTRIAADHGTVVVEDLNVAGMLRKGALRVRLLTCPATAYRGRARTFDMAG